MHFVTTYAYQQYQRQVLHCMYRNQKAVCLVQPVIQTSLQVSINYVIACGQIDMHAHINIHTLT